MPPPQRTTSTNPILFKDFSPGIADNPGVSYPAETATRANTYRCIANRAGALVPLPRRIEPFHLPHLATGPTTPIAVDGLYVPPIPVLPSSGSFTPDMFPEHELYVGLEWLESGTRHQNLYRYRRFEGDGTGNDGIHTQSFADASTVFKPNGMSFGSTRSNQTDNTHVGCPVTMCMWTFGSNQNYLVAFPDDRTPAATVSLVVFANTQFLLRICCHQGRTVGEVATVYAQGAGTVTFMGENLFWSKVNNAADWTPNADPAVAIHAFPQAFVEENPSGYACMASMSANELFAVKTMGGLYITGDLDNPTVVSLPMVTGSEISHTPVVTELGVVYGTRTSGVWAWGHGDNSNLLSGRMIPDFWAVTPGSDFDDFGGIAYQFARCDDWVLAPNNWIFDTQLKSWWRLEDEAVHQYRYMTSMSHFIYGSESFYTATSDTPIHVWKREDKTWTYSWQSQPIWQSVADIVNVDTLELIAEGQGTVTLTLTALNGDTNSITVTLANCGYPERFREAFAIQGKYLQLRVQAQSPNAFFAAPTVYSVTLYPYTEAPVGRTL